MTVFQKILFFFLLPIISPLLFPPRMLGAGLVLIIVAALLFGFLGFLLLRGSERALTLTIFIQGLNVIVRFMMLFPKATFTDGSANIVYIITTLISIVLSIYLVFRLDQVDVRTQMVA